MKLITVIPYVKKIQKYMNHVTHHLSSAGISIFQRKSENFAMSRNTDMNCILTRNFFFFNFFFLFFKDCFDKHGYMMSAKMATLGLLKIKVF